MTAREPTPRIIYVLGPGRSDTGVLGQVLSTIEGTVFTGDQRVIARRKPLPRLDADLRTHLSERHRAEFDELERRFGIGVSCWRS